MSSFLYEQPTAITEYDEHLVKRLIEKVIVYENKFSMEFKSGVTVDVEENNIKKRARHSAKLCSALLYYF